MAICALHNALHHSKRETKIVYAHHIPSASHFEWQELVAPNTTPLLLETRDGGCLRPPQPLHLSFRVARIGCAHHNPSASHSNDVTTLCYLNRNDRQGYSTTPYNNNDNATAHPPPPCVHLRPPPWSTVHHHLRNHAFAPTAPSSTHSTPKSHICQLHPSQNCPVAGTPFLFTFYLQFL